jgi:ABC-type glutathione transport system ATPase component
MIKPLLRVRDLVTVVGGGRRFLGNALPSMRAVDQVTFDVASGEIFGIVGESGSGKSTLGKTLAGILRNSGGEMLFGDDVEPAALDRRNLWRRKIQYLHQDSAAALDPWWRIGRTLQEPLIIHRISTPKDRDTLVDGILDAVGLDQSFKRRYPHELSGGQLRRIALARMLILSPRLLILDEPTAGLDLSVQATVLELLLDLRHRLGLTYVLISHDLSVVRFVCDHVAIMHKGRIVELAEKEQIFCNPRDDYTKTLLSAIPPLTPGVLIDTNADHAPV